MSSSKSIPCIFIISFLLIVAAGCTSTEDSSIYEEEEEIVEEIETGLTPQEEYTISGVNEAIDLMNDKGEQAFPEFRENNSEWFHDDFYIFVWKTDGTRVVYPPDVSGEGEDMSDLEDYNGKPIGQLFIDTALSVEGEGWVDYYWPKPGENEPSMKHTYIKRTYIGDEAYLVGSGYYPDT
ncbi:MAG: hypothetical protein AWU59_655 [Methanolobus sp. T82-4]|nr:MAG: hypothetical protein AWU59_655 [Methanolobus sp. T82-4]